jgi:hypothetical protein
VTPQPRSPHQPPAFGSRIHTKDSRLALRPAEAARAIGVSDETFDRYVKPHLRVVRLGSVRIYPVADIERFLAESGAAPIEEAA